MNLNLQIISGDSNWFNALERSPQANIRGLNKTYHIDQLNQFLQKINSPTSLVHP